MVYPGVDERAAKARGSVNDATVCGGFRMGTQSPQHRNRRRDPVALLDSEVLSVHEVRLAIRLRREDREDGKRSGVSLTSTVWPARSPLRTRTRSEATSTRAPNDSRRWAIRRSPWGEPMSRPSTVTSPPVIAAATRGKAADEKSPGTSRSVG